MGFIFKWIFRILLLAFIAIQFIQPDRSVPEYDKKKDFIALLQPPEQVANLVKKSCYDCHSYETKYPWYNYIAPVSWWLDEHIKDGRKHLNFSLWGTYSSGKANHKLEECIEEITEGHMPPSYYLIMHGGAELKQQQVEAVTNWLKTIYKEE